MLTAVKGKLGIHSSFDSLEARGRKSVDPTTVKNILDFFERDDISRQAPGQRDYVIVKNEDGLKEKIQKVRQCSARAFFLYYNKWF